MHFSFPKITIICGHYGCGKTNVCANIALQLAKSGAKTAAVDLDIVNPYFRTADFAELFKKNKVKLITPMYANSNLDIPALNFDLSAIFSEYERTVIDVGGDPEGALALARFSDELKGRSDALLYCVVNKYRYLTSSPEEGLDLLREIESASLLKCSGIINNSNLGALTDEKTVRNSLDYAEKIAEKANTSVIFTCSEEKNLSGIENAFPIKIFVKPAWEN